MKFKVIRTKVESGILKHLDGTEETNYMTIERLVLFDKEEIALFIIDRDCCHQILDARRKPSIEHNQYMCSPFIPDMPYDEFLSRLEEVEIDLTEWIHSFGIKPRIEDNYDLLIKNLKANGIDTDCFPPWIRKIPRLERGITK